MVLIKKRFDFHFANKLFLDKLKSLRAELKLDYNMHKVKALRILLSLLSPLEMLAVSQNALKLLLNSLITKVLKLLLFLLLKEKMELLENLCQRLLKIP